MLKRATATWLVLAGLLTLAGMVLPAQVPATASSQTADQLLAGARQTYSEQGGREALPKFERALALYREQRDRHGEAVVLGQIGNCYEAMSDYPHAIDYLQQSLTMKQELGDRLEQGKTLSNLGLVYWHTGDYAKAIDDQKRALDIGQELKHQQLQAAAHNNLGLVYHELGDYPRSLANYQQALELFRAIKHAEGEEEALGNIGGVHLELGEFREGEKYYRQALTIDEAHQFKRDTSDDLGNLALCQLGLGQPQDAVTTFDRALALAREGGFQQEEADWHKGNGSALVRLGKYDVAREEYRQAILVYEQAGLKREMIEALNDEGMLLAQLGDGVSAEKDYRHAIELARAIGHPAGVTANLMSLGDLEWRRQRYDQAAALYREAFARARESGEKDSMANSLVQLALALRDQGRIKEAIPSAQQALDIARSTGAQLGEAQALYALGELARRGGEHSKALEDYQAGEKIAQAAGDTELGWQLAYGRAQTFEALGRNDEAVAAYRRSVEIIEGVRNQLREERFQGGYIEGKFQVYVALVRLLLKMGKTGQAFMYSEKLRAQSYLNLLNHTHLPAANTREAELRAQIRELQQAVEEENQKPQSERKRGKVETFSARLVEAERQYQALIDDRRNSGPDDAAERALRVPMPEQVQSRLPAHTALVEYIVGDGAVAIFVVTHGSVRAKRIPVRTTELRAKIELFRDLIEQGRTDDWIKPAASLYALLVAPIEQAGWLKGVTRLAIVPHEALYYLPFAALPRPSSPARPGDNGQHFLVQDYVVSYLPAASALVYGQAAKDPEGSLFALAPASSHLPYAQEEARAVGTFFTERSLVLTGGGATETAFKRQAGRYRIIHLAGHGFFDKVNPIFSGVELEPDAKDDGRLEVHEILRLRLKARLVTLSACETALGSGYFSEFPAGDDFVGLTRAFLSAGSSAVLASLWQVNDRSTMEFMQGFYREMEKSGDAAALRNAQLAMLRAGGRYAHPYYWAPFVLVGSTK
ncbi:MAG TPA: CHAT domain-containing tetratricopeptide repeat protein [Terriglobia bacterium]|nr:CHAT domain-containing tetratricopeptide repeat protein [Terriglobia bacterium]